MLGEKDSITSFASGATSSGSCPDFAAIPNSFLQRLAQRFSEGTKKHGRGNYLQALRIIDNELHVDVDFFRDRYNHAVKHLQEMKNSNNSDDNIAAVGWFLCLACLVEIQGFSLPMLLNPLSPSQEARLQHEFGIQKETKTK